MTEELPEDRLLETGETTIYKMLKSEWKRPIKYGLLFEVMGALTAIIPTAVIKFTGIDIKVSLPIVIPEIASLELSEITVALLQASLSFSGIILGFFAVSFFFMLEMSDKAVEKYAQKIRRARTKKTKFDLRLRQIFVEGTIGGFSKYAILFVRVIVLLLLSMIILLIYCYLSAAFLFLSILLSVNSVLVASSGMFPLVKFGLYFRRREKEIEKNGLPWPSVEELKRTISTEETK